MPISQAKRGCRSEIKIWNPSSSRSRRSAFSAPFSPSLRCCWMPPVDTQRGFPYFHANDLDTGHPLWLPLVVADSAAAGVDAGGGVRCRMAVLTVMPWSALGRGSYRVAAWSAGYALGVHSQKHETIARTGEWQRSDGHAVPSLLMQTDDCSSIYTARFAPAVPSLLLQTDVWCASRHPSCLGSNRLVPSLLSQTEGDCMA